MEENALQIIEEEARTVAELHGATWSEAARGALCSRLIARLGGIQFYMPKVSSVERSERNELIIRSFDGRNIKTLARQFDLSERTIRRVVEKDGKAKMKPNEAVPQYGDISRAFYE